MTCAELEILLADYVDGTLHTAQRSALEAHAAECEACAEFVRDVTGSSAFMGRVSAAEPPAELVTRILFAIPRAAEVQRDEKSPGLWQSIRNWFEPVLQPRFAMGMAMTILSFSMLAQMSGIQVRQFKAADLDPVRVWATLDAQAHRGWERAVKYYENLKLVYEVQNRLKEWSDQDEEERKAQPAGLPQQTLTPSRTTPQGTQKQDGGEGRESK